METVRPVVHRRELRCAPGAAFDAWVRDIGRWWHPTYTPDPATYEDASIEPWVGGAVSMTCRSTGRYVWGHVEVVDAPRLLVHSSVLGQPAEHPSRITVELVAHEHGTTLRFEHGGWHPSLAQVREKFSEWPALLDRYVALADARS